MSNAPPPYVTYGQDPQQMPQQVHIVHQPATVIVQSTQQVGPGPTLMRCPNCLATITTRVSLQTSGRTHLWAIGLCLTMMWPCLFIPYCCGCAGCCKKTIHHCPNCQFFLGEF